MILYLSVVYHGRDPCVILCFLCPFYAHICVFFFFQAEDGIRDYKVTGVQTCALPIWPAARRSAAAARRWPSPPPSTACAGCPWTGPAGACAGGAPGPGRRHGPAMPPRSEERRVGEEGRSRWSPYH